MPRMARVVAPGYPHHITQRGNRRQRTFFCDEDYRAYLRLLKEWCRRCGVEIWSYCLMPNHVHLVAVPAESGALRSAIGEIHRRYTLYVNSREGWKGYLWQGRFSSYVMDDNYLVSAARYVDLNPLRAGLCERPEDYPWCSARAHLLGIPDPVARFGRLDELAGNWREFLALPCHKETAERLKAHFSTGRPLGDEAFLRMLEGRLNRRLLKRRPGPETGWKKREIGIVSP